MASTKRLILLSLLLLTACTLAWSAAATRRRGGYHEPSFVDKIMDMERQKQRFWLMVRDAKEFMYTCYYMMFGSYAEKIYMSWVHFTWRLARYYYHFLVLVEKLRGHANSLSVQGNEFVREVLDSYPVFNSPNMCMAAFSSFMLGPVFFCVMFCRRRHSALQ
ncbi:hypothetical protein DUNSADRAFT_14635 [Dunaliella salina]|uniref:Transmembrane protein n=1 Tax=Dunaliella salina TaxID=3046 RepID=A0ABQ7G738_DUNSA|nr:hypothetical protein DUNSADRAFT_14635 [Dunaliella salina]|eukprot:KAF5830414.1 hypothetical protein DUNSADRAFT_14635 [Dunaliella salina]